MNEIITKTTFAAIAPTATDTKISITLFENGLSSFAGFIGCNFLNVFIGGCATGNIRY